MLFWCELVMVDFRDYITFDRSSSQMSANVTMYVKPLQKEAWDEQQRFLQIWQLIGHEVTVNILDQGQMS